MSASVPDPLHELHRYGILTDADLYLVDALQRRCGASDDAALFLCAIASRMVMGGHVCIQGTSAAELADLGDDRELTPGHFSPALLSLCESGVSDLALSALVGTPESDAPFVLQNKRLYLRRYWQYEQLIAHALLGMAQSVDNIDLSHDMAPMTSPLMHTLEPAGSRTVPGEVPEPANVKQPDLPDSTLDGLEAKQTQAVIAALSRRFTVISGGPGTGKTFVAARILKVLAGEGKVIRLAAPTGKAASRLTESVSEAMGTHVAAAEPAVAGQPHSFEPACTLERLLGYIPGSHYFRYNRTNPLPADVLMIDEASMIDLPKMAKLLDALPAHCRLILLGDMHQLAAVGPGSVLADICAAESMQNAVVHLDVSRRFLPGSPVAGLSEAVNAGDAPEVNAFLDQEVTSTEQKDRVILNPVPAHLVDHDGNVDVGLAADILRGYRDFALAGTPEAAFSALENYRVLCARRTGPHGVHTLNRIIENVLSEQEELPFDCDREFYDHRVVMITRNDYALELFNGDIGVVLPSEPRSAAGADDNAVVWFENGEGGYRQIPCRLLPEHETGFAMTVHKSQGSEFKRIMVILPADESPVLTRELLYTAITRTRTGVDLYANRDILDAAVSRTVERSSGLLDQLKPE